mmetsp:Transcript_35255/g.109811  ORF Transcript_35255/g.109811 Transcript_35255/m.109811 type:complete len:410 (-) Transcript_35255:33-1262(-)
MDYFAVGGRPLLSRFPPYIPGSFGARLPERQGSAGWPGEPPAEDLQVGTASSSALKPSDAASVAATGASSRDGDASDPQAVRTPAALHSGFDPKEVRPWEPSRFELIRKLQDATRNRGQVHLMRDVSEDRLVAVKQMPNRWIRNCHSDFVIEHPAETEMPWQDVGCVSFLNSAGYSYACSLFGVYRDDLHTYVVTSFASEGDLFSWCEAGVAPGLEREVVVHPLARQMMEGMQQLHDFSIVHRDLSLENVLLSKLEHDSLRIRIIDFSMASTSRRFSNCVRGKASYQAPELHTSGEYDAFLTDAFSLGVTLYAVLLKDYPWLSTRPGGCKCFEYVRKHGFRSYLAKRKLRNSSVRVADVVSEPLKQLLEGMLAFDPADRLTLGERAWGADSGRRSVWDEPWIHNGPGAV